MARKKDVLGTREKTIHFRVSEAFYEVIAHEARQCGLGVSCSRNAANKSFGKKLSSACNCYPAGWG